MPVTTNLMFLNNSPILYGLGVLLLLLSFLIFYLVLRKKTKALSIRNQLIEKEIVQLKTALNSKSESLEEKVAQKTKVLLEEIENQKLVESDRKISLKHAEDAIFLKNSFFANMSHEIRTPLNGIIGFSHLLLSEVESQEKPELVEFAKVITESSHRLLHLMENIIDLSRIDTNDYELRMKDFEVNTLIGRCLARIKEEADKKNLVLEFISDQAYWIPGDEVGFEKSIDLIFDNAVKYTPNGKISISLQADAETGRLRILISDTGIGIDKSFLSNIFDAYSQKSTGYSRFRQGAGLGLPLAQKLILLMGGEIQVESEISKGTKVSLLFSLSNFNSQITDADQTQPNKQGSSQPTKKTQALLFIVEDDKMNRLVFDQMLSKYANFQMAIDGEDAFKQLEKAMQTGVTFDLFLIDIRLPDPWDGLMLQKEFRKRWPILRKVPFVAQTAYAIAGDKEKFLAEGFDDYISKPIDKKELISIIENNLRKFNVLREKLL